VPTQVPFGNDKKRVMRVQVLYFGILKDVFGLERDQVELADGGSVEMLTDLLRLRSGVGEGLWRSVAVAVNQEYVRGSVVLRDGDEVALLPPVSGG